MFQDKKLVCKDCGKEFIFSTSEQEFYKQKGFKNEPVRCPECRKIKKENFRNKNRKFKNNNFSKKPKVMYDAVCAECGKPTKIPFKPINGKPVYCSECFEKIKNQNKVKVL